MTVQHQGQHWVQHWMQHWVQHRGQLRLFSSEFEGQAAGGTGRLEPQPAIQGDIGLHTHGFFLFKPMRQDYMLMDIFFIKPRRHRTTYTWTYIYNRLTCAMAGAAAAAEGRALLWYSPEFVRTLNIPSCWALDAVCYHIMD